MDTADARETIYGLIREARGDRLGGMSVYSTFLEAHRNADDDQAAALVQALAEIVESDSGEMLIVGAWLAGTIALENLVSDYLELAVRRRLMELERVADQLAERDRHALDALRRADAAIAAAQ